METEHQSLDRISTLPKHIIEDRILSLMPIRDALRTSILSKKFRYCWRSMPKLVFTNNMIQVSPSKCGWLIYKHKVVNAIFHVLLLHNGPKILEFDWSLYQLDISSELDQIISRLPTRNNTLKELIIVIRDGYYKLPVSFFSLQGLEHIHLQNCGFKPHDQLTFDGFSRLRGVLFNNVEISHQMLQVIISNCPLIEEISLDRSQIGCSNFAVGGKKFTFVDLFKCLPFIHTLDISKDYMKYLCAGDMPRKFSRSLAHLRYLYLDVCLMERNEISAALCMIKSSPFLLEIGILMYNERLPIRKTPINFLDPENYSNLKLDHLKTLQIEGFSNLPLEMEFVKLIMAKSPVLKEVLIELDGNVSVDEELKMLRDFIRLPFPRASPSAKLIIERPETCL